MSSCNSTSAIDCQRALADSLPEEQARVACEASPEMIASRVTSYCDLEDLVGRLETFLAKVRTMPTKLA